MIIAEKLQRESENDGNPSAEIRKADLNQIIGKYIEDNKDEYYEEKATIKKEQEFLKIIAERVCFLCENREGYYSFSIRTMQEYFAGTYLVKNKSDSEALQNIRDLAYKFYWRNTLLFALGYVELEKKHLEGDIGRLCEEMCGIDNLTKADYTSENICLYGAWLAVDILIEDIFKGKAQDKYIRYAAQTLKLSGCKMFSKFSLLTGVQCVKLHAHIKDIYESEKKYINNVLSLYIVLHENKKNNMEGDIVSLLKKCDEEDKIKFCIQLLDKDVHFSNKAIAYWKDLLIQYIKDGKVKQSIPERVLKKLNYDDVIMKRFLLMQCFRNEEIYGELVNNIFGMNKGIIIKQLCNVGAYSKELEIKITYGVSYYFYEPIFKNYDELKNFAEELELPYIVMLSEFLTNPNYDRYRKLLHISNEDEREIVKRNLERLYFKYEDKSECEFNLCIKNRERILQLFKQKNIKELLVMNECYGLGYMAKCSFKVFDDLMKKQSDLVDIHNLGDVFLRSYGFVAAVQIESWDKNRSADIATINRLIQLLQEINQRKLYVFKVCTMVMFILNSKNHKELQRTVENLDFVENMSNEQIINEILYRGPWNRFKEYTEKIISTIVRHTIGLAKENNYLIILLKVFMKDGRFSAHISSDDMRELEQINCKNDYNKLAIYLLKLCNNVDENLGTLIESIVNLEVHKKLLYSVVANILYNCEMNNKDKVWTLVYFHLEQEEFEEQKELLNEMVDNMIEIKGNS